MTIVQKAQRFDEAIERARKELQICGSQDCDAARQIFRFFPELAESEDEKMVKFIKNQLFNIKKTITENYELDAKLTNAIDWLEKQGEQKSTWSEEDENLFRCAIDAVEQESKVRTDGCLDEEVGKMVTDWLKSLKNRYT